MSQSLFGDTLGWQSSDWTDSDDRVRGGKSQSYLACTDAETKFYGNLDIDTLGGAGFASQRTTGEDRQWDLSAYNAIELCIGSADDKQYTFILKDELLPPNSRNVREQATISYEYDFKVPNDSIESSTSIPIPFSKLQATYRGKEKKDAPSVNVKNIKRISLMVRSFFGTQKGDFELNIVSIKAVKTQDARTNDPQISLTHATSRSSSS